MLTAWKVSKYGVFSGPYLETFDRVTIQEIISNTAKFEKLNEDPTLNGEAWLQRFSL